MEKRKAGNPNIRNIGFGSRPREVDDEYRSRIKGVPRRRLWTRDKCLEELEDILQHFKKILREDAKIEVGKPLKLKRESIRDLNTMMGRILDFMRYLYPPVQQNVNLNVDMTAEKVMERIKGYCVEEGKEEI